MNDPYVEEPISSISRTEAETNLDNHKFSNQNGGNFIIGKHEHKILPIFSRKYTLDQAAVRNPSEIELEKLNDIVSNDDEVKLTPLPRRGILKKYNSDSIQSDEVSEHPAPLRHSNSEPNTRVKYRIHFPNFKPRISSSQEFTNPAFEPDETAPKDFKLRDLVEQALRQQNEDFLHPYGRSNLYTTVFVQKESTAQTDGSKLAFWGILLLVILGMAGGIIFMAEMHQLENSSDINSTVNFG